ncbi:(2Fe-2S)-binding protein [Citreicella sp. C3M06]|uniref:(2Fe-2S)-binding protein n=1 Tax=Citreicella sp. C3M06 TaxID=2841564 RepID=UPI001C08568D|nr:(2Fe-2S)-binding protein [Citreicella sp. C3M06]MBU2961648.1 (2Fe-2S)-binding protein [Citreicella sp. C3M06]
MFRTIEMQPPRQLVEISVDGRRVSLPEGANLAAALLGANAYPARRTPAGGVSRAPFCMMGVCFDCLAEIDGEPNRQTCLTTVRGGMTVRRQTGAAQIVEGRG